MPSRVYDLIIADIRRHHTSQEFMPALVLTVKTDDKSFDAELRGRVMNMASQKTEGSNCKWDDFRIKGHSYDFRPISEWAVNFMGGWSDIDYQSARAVYRVLKHLDTVTHTLRGVVTFSAWCQALLTALQPIPVWDDETKRWIADPVAKIIAKHKEYLADNPALSAHEKAALMAETIPENEER